MRSEAQKAADKRYDEQNRDKTKLFQAKLLKAEEIELEELLKRHNLKKVDFVRRAVEALKKGNLL